MERSIEDILRDLPARGTCVKDRGYRQIWRFSAGGKGYYLKFYPRRASLMRLVRANPALREMRRLQWLQQAKVPGPRASGVLVGFALNGVKGDALLLEAIEPSVSLEQALTDAMLQGRRPAEYRRWLMGVVDLLQRLEAGGLGHEDLHLGNLLVKDGQIYLIDAVAVRRGGLRRKQLMLLEHSARPWLSRADRARAWFTIKPGLPLPRHNTLSLRYWRKFVKRSLGDNRYFGAWQVRGQRGLFMRRYPRPARGSWVSRGQFERAAVEALWERALSAEAMPAQGVIQVQGRAVPLRFDAFPRVRRAWLNAWRLIVRGLETPWPLAMAGGGWMAREGGECVSLSAAQLDEWSADHRQRFFWRLGQFVRQMNDTLLHHRSLKSESFLVRMDERLGLMPVLNEVSPITPRRRDQWSLPSLLSSLKSHAQYTAEDSFWLCRGYAPGAAVRREEA